MVRPPQADFSDTASQPSRLLRAGLTLLPPAAAWQSNLPRVITQVVLTGSKIFGRAMYEAGRQAYKSASVDLLLGAASTLAFSARELDLSTSADPSQRLALRSDTQYRPENPQAGGEEGGAAADGSGSPSTTAGITRSLRMTLQEAQLILNVKEGETAEKLREVGRCFSPPPALSVRFADEFSLSCLPSATTFFSRPTRRQRSTRTHRRRRR